MTSGLCDCCTAKTVITKFQSDDAVFSDGRRTSTLRCAAITDQLTPLRISWTLGNNNSCATWRAVDEHQQQVLVELDQSQTCCAIVACSVSNGLSEDSSSSEVCSKTGTRTLPTSYIQGMRRLRSICNGGHFLFLLIILQEVYAGRLRADVLRYFSVFGAGMQKPRFSY